ncbi:uncharacterized protein LOC126570934 [Anopheles aquasalis]|uniref:uncharacterized protein LOC126570934 n=1 Tax=Anopheles aquasalis TaxID=42839 RepID=UPI00215A1651|nr:uncharacterized protein LOC126570934 [Anopheles aquasalis]
MPSLQQTTTYEDFASSDIARSLTGPDILQKHSINSLLLENNEIIIEDNMSMTDLLGGGSQASSPTSVTSSLMTSSSSGSSMKNGTAAHPNHQLLQPPPLQGTGHHANSHHLHLNTHHHHPTLGSFSSINSLGGGGGGNDDSPSSILSSIGFSGGIGSGITTTTGSNTSGSGISTANPFNFGSLRIQSPSLNSPDLAGGAAGLLGVGIGIGRDTGSSASSSSSSSSSSSGVSCGGAGSGSDQSPTAHAFYSPPGGGTVVGGIRSHGSEEVCINGSTGCYDEFRFDNDLMIGCGGGVGSGVGETMTKLRRRNISFDCSSPTTGSSSSGTGTPPSLTLNTRNIRNQTYNQLLLQQQQQQQQHQQQQQYDQNSVAGTGSIEGCDGFDRSPNTGGNGVANNSSLALFANANKPLSRPQSPLSFDSKCLINMLNMLTLNQSNVSQNNLAAQVEQQHQNSNQQQYQNQFNPYSNHGSLQHQQPMASGSNFGSVGGGNGCNGGNGGLTNVGNGFITDSCRSFNNLQAILQQCNQLNQSVHTTATNNNAYGSGGSNVNQSNAGTNSGSTSARSSMGLRGWSAQQQHQPQLSQRQGSTSPLANCSPGGNGYADVNLDRIARYHRSSAAHFDATCTWSGVLPPRSNRTVTYSCKIFLGGMPWDISEQSLLQIFKPYGSIKVEWPGKEQQATQPKGYVYIIFESDKQVKALLQSCTFTTPGGGNGGMASNNYGSNRTLNSASSTSSLNNYATICDDSSSSQQQLVSMSSMNKLVAPRGARINFKISSKRIKSKDVEVIPWNIADSNYVKSASQKLDPAKTVFVGALHGQLTAEGLAKIMNDLFDGVVYVGIDTDKYKYPLGSARVTFNNSRSYMKAVVAAFIEIRTAKFTKKLQVDPYLEDALCSVCSVQHGPYFCREIMCFRYFCRSCWQFQHNREAQLQNHKPLTRNSKSTTIIGVGPQSSHAANNHSHLQQNNSFDHGNYHNGGHQHHFHNGGGGGGGGGGNGGNGGTVGHQSNSTLASHNQYHPANNHHHHHGSGFYGNAGNGGSGGYFGHHQPYQSQQQQAGRLSMLQQRYRDSMKSPSPLCNGLGSSTGDNNGASSSPITVNSLTSASIHNGNAANLKTCASSSGADASDIC